MVRLSHTVFALMLVIVVAADRSALAQPDSGQPPRINQAKPAKPPKVTASKKPKDPQKPAVVRRKKNEEQAMKFAEKHHPELAKLLQQLRKNNTAAYQKAIQEVYGAAVNLERMRQRSPRRYELKLQLWQVSSQIRLLAAEYSVTADSGMEDKLRTLLGQRQKLRIAAQRFEHTFLEERLKKSAEALKKMESNSDQVVERELKMLRDGLKLRKTSAPNPAKK